MSRSDPRIQQLVAAQYPLDEYQSKDRSTPNYMPSRRLRKLDVEIDAYERMLAILDPETFDLLFESERKRLSKRQQDELEQRMKEYRLDDDKAQADFSFWSAMETWTIEEATALAMGLSPKRINLRIASQRRELEVAQRYVELHDLAERARIKGTLKDPTGPRDFLRWVVQHKQYVCPAFVSQIPKQDEQLGKTVAKLKEENQRQKILISEYKARNRNYGSMQKVLLSIAIEKFHFKMDGNSGAAKKLSDICDLRGMSVGQDTIKKMLVSASRELASQRNQNSDKSDVSSDLD